MARNLPIYYRTVSAFEVETPIRLDDIALYGWEY